MAKFTSFLALKLSSFRKTLFGIFYGNLVHFVVFFGTLYQEKFGNPAQFPQNIPTSFHTVCIKTIYKKTFTSSTLSNSFLILNVPSVRETNVGPTSEVKKGSLVGTERDSRME
jgi:hypothetical protein